MLLLAALLSACNSDGDKDGKPAAQACTEATAKERKEIGVAAAGFEVKCAKATVGESVLFINRDSVRHTVTTRASSPTKFDAELKERNVTFNRSFRLAGRYPLFCTIHKESMTLLVVAAKG